MSKFYDSYWSRRIEAQEKGKGANEQRHFQVKWPKLRKYLPSEAGAIILDYGCGDGSIIKAMREINSTATYVGIDVSERALHEAEASLRDVQLHCVNDGGAFPLEDKSVDFIFTSEVLEHVYDTEKALSEMYRVLRPGGRLLLTTPYHGPAKNALIVLFNFENHFNPTGPHIRFFSKKSLFRCLTEAGLKILDYGYFGRFYPIPHCIFVYAER